MINLWNHVTELKLIWIKSHCGTGDCHREMGSWVQLVGSALFLRASRRWFCYFQKSLKLAHTFVCIIWNALGGWHGRAGQGEGRMAEKHRNFEGTTSELPVMRLSTGDTPECRGWFFLWKNRTATGVSELTTETQVTKSSCIGGLCKWFVIRSSSEKKSVISSSLLWFNNHRQ